MRISDWSSDVCSSDLIGPSVSSINATKWSPVGSRIISRLPSATATNRCTRRLFTKKMHGSKSRSVARKCITTVNSVWLRTGHITRGRLEEHTCELQSLMRTTYAGFCLKKKHQTQHNPL